MKKLNLLLITLFIINILSPNKIKASDWDNVSIPKDLTDYASSENYKWQLLDDFSDDFNYTFNATNKESYFGENNKWINRYHNTWKGHLPTVWEYENSSVNNGNLLIKATRSDGETCVVDGKTVPKTHLGCISSVKAIIYPVYIEANVKLCAGQFASDIWMLTPDNEDQEIDICEAYGAEQFGYYESIHLSHHVFVRDPWKDYQPSGNFYKGEAKFGTENINWRDAYHKVGVFWKDATHLYYFIDGNMVHSVVGMSVIDPYGYTKSGEKEGLWKSENIIINMEHQYWLATSGYNTTDAELKDIENSTFRIDWIRAYKFTPSTGIKDNTKGDIKIYNNNGKQSLKINSPEIISNMSITNIDGNIIFQKQINKNVVEVNTSAFAPGIYITNIQLKNGNVINNKFILAQ